MNLSEVVALPDGISGIDIEGDIEKVFPTRQLTAKKGKTAGSKFTCQNIIVTDINDVNIKCTVGITRNFIDVNTVGERVAFPKCKKGTYTDGEGNSKTQLSCGGDWTCTSDIKAASEAKPDSGKETTKPHKNTSTYPDYEERQQKQLYIIRQSSLDRATSLYLALTNSGVLPKNTDPNNYIQEEATKHVNFVYTGTHPIQDAKYKYKVEGEDSDGIMKQIEIIKKAQVKYKFGDIDIIDIMGKMFNTDDMTKLSFSQLGELLTKIVAEGLSSENQGEKNGEPKEQDIPF